MQEEKKCPECGATVECYRNPTPTTDIIIHDPTRGLVLIERLNEPHGWALPGGFVDLGETVDAAAVREAKEETNLDVVLTGLLGVYSDPARDPRQHTMSVVYTAVALDPGRLRAGDDAGKARFFPLDQLPGPLAFDHGRIVADYSASLSRLKG